MFEFKLRKWAWIFIVAVVAGGIWYLSRIPKNISAGDGRMNILVLGIRGKDDPDAEEGGALLTDTIQIFSIDQNAKKATIVSVPRDIYVTIGNDPPGGKASKKDKINVVYEYGTSHSGNDLEFIDKYMSQFAGVHIDKTVVFDFSSFKSIIDALGGVDIILDKPFDESTQWGYSFHLPAGKNHLNGENALYYVRSRYSTNDFDRSRRQQEIVIALKNKLAQINFFSEPLKTLKIYNMVRQNVRTDIGILDISNLVGIAHSLQNITIEHHIISTENLLVESRASDGAYILLPRNNDWGLIQKFFKDILTPAPQP